MCPLAYGTYDLYFGVKCDNRRATAMWTQSCVTRRRQCDSNTVLWHGMPSWTHGSGMDVSAAYMLSQRPRPLTHGAHAGTRARARARVIARVRVRSRARVRAMARWLKICRRQRMLTSAYMLSQQTCDHAHGAHARTRARTRARVRARARARARARPRPPPFICKVTSDA